jgi:4-hydroxy-4-methyl-2-oxoglutarate aldolase
MLPEFAHLKEGAGVIRTSILSDVLDGMGLRRQAMRPFIRPLDESLMLFGRARTGFYMTVYEAKPGENPYAVEIALLDDLAADDIPVLACGGPTERIAPWGELLSTAARCRGAAGCVTDGLVRDVHHIRAMRFPVFHGGIGPLDSRGRGEMVDMDVAVECGGVLVRSGDYVFGDVDGVIVIPHEAAREALAKAEEKATGENRSRDELLRGRLLKDVYDAYGIL